MAKVLPTLDPAAVRRFSHPTPDDRWVIAALARLQPLAMPEEVVTRVSDAWDQGAAVARPAERWTSKWAVPISIAASIALVLSLSSVILRASGATVVVDDGPVFATGTDYSNGTLSREVPRLLGQAGLLYTARASMDAPVAATSDQLTGSFAATSDAVRSCVAGYTAAPAASVIAVDVGTYRGTPAGVVVTRIPGQSSLQVTVVPLTCSYDDPALLDQVRIIDG